MNRSISRRAARPRSRSGSGRRWRRPRARPAGPRRIRDFDVVIAGGITAAFAAAVASAESGARTALIEPTDWVGGQLTASAVPAVDEAWHKVTDPKTKEVYNVSAIARKRENMTPNFRAMLDATGNPGGGWVSNYCFQPRDFLDQHLLPLEAELKEQAGRLPRHGRSSRSRSTRRPAGSRSITAIRRTPRAGVAWAGYDRPLSDDLADWYVPSRLGPVREGRPDLRRPTTGPATDDLPRRDRVGRGPGAWPTPRTSRGSRPSTAVARGTTPAARRPVVDIVERINPGRSRSRRVPRGSRTSASAATGSSATPGTGSGPIAGSGARGARRPSATSASRTGDTRAATTRGATTTRSATCSRPEGRRRGRAGRLAGRGRPRGPRRRREAGDRLALLVQGPRPPAVRPGPGDARPGRPRDRDRPGQDAVHPRHPPVDRPRRLHPQGRRPRRRARPRRPASGSATGSRSGPTRPTSTR